MTLHDIGVKYGTDKAYQHGYCRFYESIFSSFRNYPFSMLEIGVQFGLSIKMWLEYFPEATIHGVDIIQNFVSGNNRFTFWRGDQRDVEFWNRFKASVGNLQLIIDDGCHNADAQKISFECLWDKVSSGGWYIIEDVETWWDNYFNSSVYGVGWMSHLLGDLNWHGKDYHGKPTPPLKVSDYERSIESIILRKGLVAIKKSSQE